MPHELSIQQILRLLQAAKEQDELHWLAMAVAFNHALRASEVIAIKPSFLVDGKITMRRKKRSNDVNDELVEHENILISERKPLLELASRIKFNQRLFPVTTRTFQRWVHAAGESAGLPELLCHPHTLKHSILFFLRRNGMDIDQLRPYSGHKHVDSLNVYSGFTREETEPLVRAAFGKIPLSVA
ncbi:MAG TPA: site-specific integrase [Terriglobales bacterium]|jgi:integrase